MSLKMDRFTWAVVIVVVLLLVSAVATLSLSRDRASEGSAEYLTEDSPTAVVHNVYVAFRRGDVNTARQHYSSAVLESDDGMFKNRFDTFYPRDNNQRLRILSVEMQGEEAALVTIALDNYSTGGIFDSGSTWTQRQTISLIREDGSWKIDSQVYFY
ncbi:MAG: hypothetical protein KF893_27270 [Caldilineaceae bacterium]|nr:hypothetical protein [Caldilineaceae bacterium]